MAEVAVAPIVNEGPPMMLVGVDKALQMIGFESEAKRAGIVQAGLGRFEYFRYLVEKDICDMVDDFLCKCTQANGRIVFGLEWDNSKKLTGVMHWG